MTNWYDNIVTSLKNSLEAVFIKKSNTNGLVKNDGTIDTSNYLTSSSITGKADKSNGASQITDTNASGYGNISSNLSSSSTQANINDAIDDKFGEMETVTVTVTFTDNSTQDLVLFKQVAQSNQ